MDTEAENRPLLGSKTRATLLFVALALGLYLSSLYNYMLFHSLAEIFSVVIAFAIFAVAWNARRFLDSHYLLLIGIASLFVGGIDFVHTLAYKGMGVFTGFEPTNLGAQLWIAARYMGAVSFLIATLFVSRKIRTGVAFAVYAIATILVLLSVFYWRNFPLTFVVGSGLTPFKVISEYIISFILLCSIGLTLKYRRQLGSMAGLMIAAMTVNIVSEMAFTLYVDAYGIANMVGHFLKVLSFYFIYKAIIQTGLTKPYDLLFHQLKQREESLASQAEELSRHVQEQTKELLAANKGLQVEVSERKLAEATIKAERQRFNDALDMLPAYLVLLSPDYHVPFANRFFRERFGESNGKRCFEYLFGRTEPCENCETFTVLKTMKRHHWEWTGPDNHNYDIHDFPFTDADGSTLIMEVGIDITERKKAEGELRKAHDLLEVRVRERTRELGEANRALEADVAERKRAEDTLRLNAFLLSNVGETVFSTDDKYRIRTWNKTAEMLYGWSENEIIGKDWHEALRIEYPQNNREDALKSLFENGSWRGEVIHRKKDGTPVQVQVTRSLLKDEQGQFQGVTVVAQDITERKKAEESLRTNIERLKLLSEAGSLLLSSDSPESIVQTIAGRVMTHLNCDIFVNYILDETKGSLKLNAYAGIPEDTARSIADLNLGVAICGCVARDGDRIVSENVQCNGDERAALVRSFGMQAYACHPLRAGEKTIGTLSFGTRSRTSFTDDELDLMRTLTDQVSVAMQRRRAEAEIAHLASFPELNPNPILEMDKAGDITYLNPAAKKRFPDLLEQGRAHPFMAGWDAVADRLVEERTLSLEQDIQVGNEWFMQTATYVPSNQHFRIYARDITERKQAEEALARAAREWQATFDSITDMVSIQDANFRLVKVNRAFATRLGKTPDELTGKICYEVMHHTHSPVTSCPHKETLQTGQPVTREFFEPRLQAYLEVSTSPICDDSGKIIGSAHIARDITERKRVEEAVRETRDYLENLFNYANTPIIVWDTSFRITRFNHAFERLTEMKAGDVLGKNLDILFPQESTKESMGFIRRAAAGERWEVVEIPILRTDGEVRTVLWNSATIYAADGKTAVATIAQGQDITERKQAEISLQKKTDELARSNDDLEHFAYVASHDLQEPLRMISSYVQLLANRYRGRLDKDADDFINYATDGATRMQRLINDLLAYSRVGTRGKPFEQMSLETSLAQAVENLSMKITESGARVTHDPLPSIYGDQVQIAQVFQNLIDNAIKFRGEKPPRIHVSASIKEGECICSINDNGIGIDPQYNSKLFALFQRLHTRREYPGTGLGLAICKRIIERHGGRIWVESQPGGGATFYFSIPVNRR